MSFGAFLSYKNWYTEINEILIGKQFEIFIGLQFEILIQEQFDISNRVWIKVVNTSRFFKKNMEKIKRSSFYQWMENRSNMEKFINQIEVGC